MTPDCGPDPRFSPNPIPSPAEISKLPPDGGAEFNRLIHETSPYLLQHARDPVDWYPWGSEAFDRAEREHKAVFLSIGYASCHWCHVMAQESFQRTDVAELLNESFVSVKVDREEHPEVDEIYLTATELLTGRGGWPNSLWLTPERKPWFAGSYIPREDVEGRQGFLSLLRQTADLWRTQRNEVEAQAEEFYRAMRRIGAVPPAGTGELSLDSVMQAVSRLRAQEDKQFGGFGCAPKFPQFSALQLLLSEYRRTRDESLLTMTARALKAMAQGGIRDHLGGGFYRYAVDARWFLPHFEKMLGDNAQMASLFIEGWLLTRDEDMREAARTTLDWVLRELTGPEGAFYAALDADSEGVEGKYYLWTRAEVLGTLGTEEGTLFGEIYGLSDQGNLTGVHEIIPGANLPYLPRSWEQAAAEYHLPQEELRARMAAARARLLAQRDRRIRPRRDEQVLTAWNGLIIGALAGAARHFGERAYLVAAERAATFMLNELRSPAGLLRSYSQGKGGGEACLDDYVFLADGMLELHAATKQAVWLEAAERLMLEMDARFRDREQGGYYFSAGSRSDLLYRYKNPFDRATPAGNGLAVQVWVRLGRMRANHVYLDLAAMTLRSFLAVLQRPVTGLESLMQGLAQYLSAGSRVSETRESAASPAAAEGRVQPVTAEAFMSQERSAADAAVPVLVRLEIDPGWYVHSHWPLQPYLPPLSLALEDHPDAVLERVDYPEDEKVTLPFSAEPLAVYQKSVALRAYVRFRRGPGEGGLSPLRLALCFQACEREKCGPAERLELTLPVLAAA